MSKLIMRAAHTALAVSGFEFKEFQHLGQTVHYVAGGDPNGPLCAVLPGLGDNFGNWAHFLLRYRKRLRLAAIDFPGYTGLSNASSQGDSLTFAEQLRVAEKFIEALGRKVDYLIGNSMGGWLGAKLAIKFPTRIENLVLVNPAGFFRTEADALEARKMYEIQSYADFLRLMRLLWHKVPRYFYAYSLLGLYQFMRGDTLSRVVRSVEHAHLLNEDLAKITQKVSLIWGESDRLFPVELAQEFRKDIRNLAYYPLPATGHMPQLERPTQFFKVIDEILRHR